jgi:hypothetical protein
MRSRRTFGPPRKNTPAIQLTTLIRGTGRDALNIVPLRNEKTKRRTMSVLTSIRALEEGARNRCVTGFGHIYHYSGDDANLTDAVLRTIVALKARLIVVAALPGLDRAARRQLAQSANSGIALPSARQRTGTDRPFVEAVRSAVRDPWRPVLKLEHSDRNLSSGSPCFERTS